MDAPAPASVPAAERRRALAALLDLWRTVARDLAVAATGATRSIADPTVLDDVDAIAGSLPPGAAASALERLVRASELLEANVAPELVLDVLVLRWPRRIAA